MRWVASNTAVIALVLVCGFSSGCSSVREPQGNSARPLLSTDHAWYLDHETTIDAKRVESPRRWDALRLLSSWEWDEPYWLHSIPEADEVYRLYYKPSLYNGSIVRVVRVGKVWTLAVRTQKSQVIRRLQNCILAKSQANPLACPLTRPVVDYERVLSAQEVTRMQHLLHRLDFWHLPKTVITEPALDAVDWSLEGFNEQHPDTYQIVRHDPAITGTFYRFCNYLLVLGEVKRH